MGYCMSLFGCCLCLYFTHIAWLKHSCKPARLYFKAHMRMHPALIIADKARLLRNNMRHDTCGCLHHKQQVDTVQCLSIVDDTSRNCNVRYCLRFSVFSATQIHWQVKMSDYWVKWSHQQKQPLISSQAQKTISMEQCSSHWASKNLSKGYRDVKYGARKTSSWAIQKSTHTLSEWLSSDSC